MFSKLVQLLGVLFVLLLVGGAIAGLMIVKDRISVVVAPEAKAAGADPVALLRDDVQVVSRDLAALQQALGSNFEGLAGGLDERAVERHQEVLALRRELAATQAAAQARIGSLEVTIGALRADVAAVASSARVAAAAVPAERPPERPPAPAAAAGDGPSAPAVALAAVPEAGAGPQAVPAPAGGVTPPPASGTGAASKPRGFLSFQVPNAQFRFTEPQDFTIVPELSRVGFDAKSTLHDFTGVTSAVRGGFRADFDDPAGAWSGQVTVAASTLKTGVDGRDTNMLDYLDCKQHPEIQFALGRFTPAPDGIDVAKMTARGELAGTMTIRGKSRAVTMPVTIEVDPQRRAVINGQMPLLLTDYEVPVPSQLGLISMQDEVKVWIALRARVQAGAAK